MALVAGFIVRVVWNVIPAMNASVIGEWDMSGGSDPWYMKRIIDYVAYERATRFLIRTELPNGRIKSPAATILMVTCTRRHFPVLDRRHAPRRSSLVVS